MSSRQISLIKNEKVAVLWFTLSVFFASLCSRHRWAVTRTTRGKRWIVLTQLDSKRQRERGETASISCYEYESVHHQDCIKPNQWRGERKRFFSLNLRFQLADRLSMPVAFCTEKRIKLRLLELYWLSSLFENNIGCVQSRRDKRDSRRCRECLRIIDSLHPNRKIHEWLIQCIFDSW